MTTSPLVTAIQKTSMTTTANGDITHATSANVFVDLFYKLGASRANPESLVPEFTAALATDLGIAVRLLLWARDVRGGAGERAVFKVLAKEAINAMTADQAARFVKKIPEVGRWDDVWRLFYKTKYHTVAFDYIAESLLKGDALCAKWCPREKSANANVANALRRHMQLSNSQYRKLLVKLTTVVETQMCKNEWEAIELSHVPSQAMNNYSGAFARRAPEKWEDYITKVESGEAKINAGAIYPYQLLSHTYHTGFTMSAQQAAQWAALPNFAGDNNGKILPVVDVSGSMMSPLSSDSSVTCLHVAMSLGLYLSERLNGAFKDTFVTFAGNPSLQVLKGDMNQRLKQLSKADWGTSTDFDKVFKTVLNAALKHNVDQRDMPHTMIIFSDMQFNDCMNGSSNTATERVKQMYADAGYVMPQLVFWNLHASKNSPVVYDTSGTALVSGFSPSMLKNLLSGEDMTPVAVMMKTLMVARYNW
jgi:hypothetical protein